MDSFYDAVLWRILPKDRTLRAIARSRLLTGIYYLLRGTFYREQRALLCGAAKYHELEEKQRQPRHRIIRSVHRIEKGLSMRDRRERFAEGYIRDVVSDVEYAWEQRDDDEQLKWAIDVLNEYFSTVGDSPVIDQAETTFTEFLETIDYVPEDRVPFPRSEVESSPVAPEDLKQLAVRRTSTRWFEQKPVSRDRIDDAISVAMQSPSACNRQSYEYRVYDDPELIEEISSLAVGAQGYNDNIPCLVVLVGKQRAYFDARDRHVTYIDASLSAMAFQFSLETQGLASCCINWPALPRREQRMEEILGLECDEHVVMLMAVGHPDPDGVIPYSQKKDVQSVRSYNDVR
jgi:nitroreductase